MSFMFHDIKLSHDFCNTNVLVYIPNTMWHFRGKLHYAALFPLPKANIWAIRQLNRDGRFFSRSERRPKKRSWESRISGKTVSGLSITQILCCASSQLREYSTSCSKPYSAASRWQSLVSKRGSSKSGVPASGLKQAMTNGPLTTNRSTRTTSGEPSGRPQSSPNSNSNEPRHCPPQSYELPR